MHQFIVSLHGTKHGFILGLLQNSIGQGSGGLYVPIRTLNRRATENPRPARQSGRRMEFTSINLCLVGTVRLLATCFYVYLTQNWEAFCQVVNMFSRDKLWELEKPGWATESNVHIITVLGVTAICFAVVRVFFFGIVSVFDTVDVSTLSGVRVVCAYTCYPW